MLLALPMSTLLDPRQRTDQEKSGERICGQFAPNVIVPKSDVVVNTFEADDDVVVYFTH
jgi:hypothetical protein